MNVCPGSGRLLERNTVWSSEAAGFTKELNSLGSEAAGCAWAMNYLGPETAGLTRELKTGKEEVKRTLWEFEEKCHDGKEENVSFGSEAQECLAQESE